MPTQPVEHQARADKQPARADGRARAAAPGGEGLATAASHLQRTVGNQALARRAGVVQRASDPEAARASIAAIVARTARSGPAPAVIQRKWSGGGGFYTDDRNGSTYDEHSQTFTGPPLWQPAVKDARAHAAIMANIRKDVPEQVQGGDAEEGEAEAPPWAYENRSVTKTNSRDARADLEVLIGKIGTDEVFGASSGTIVGGRNIRGRGRKIYEGMKDYSARIDIQNPPGPGLHNVQYQVGGISYAGVNFHDDDAQEIVLQELLESFNRGLMAISPLYQQNR
jgi:hypothetical protein